MGHLYGQSYAQPPYPHTNPLTGRGTRILRIPSLRLRGISGQMVGEITEDGFPRGDDVSASSSHEGLERERY